MKRAFILLSGFFGGCFLEALIPPYSPDKALRLPVTAILAIILGQIKKAAELKSKFSS
jgi:hypothetical protein